MAHFQRVPFDLLPPEQQQDLMDKQLSYKRQREMLLQQIEEKKQSKTENKKHPITKSEREEEHHYQTNVYQMHEVHHYSNGIPENFVIPPLQNLSVTLPQQKPLLAERSKPPERNSFNGSSSYSSAQIKDSFTHLRHQIRSTAANAVITNSPHRSPRSPRYTSTCNETNYLN